MASYGDAPPEFQAATSAGRLLPVGVWLAIAGVGLAVGEAAFQVGRPPLDAAWGWLAGAMGLAVAVAILTWRASGRAPAIGLVLLAGVLGGATFRNLEVARSADRVITRAVAAAVASRDRNLASAIAAAGQIGRNALDRVGTAVPGEAPALRDLLASGPIEMGVVVLGGDTVVALAGPQRAAPEPASSDVVLLEGPFARVLLVSTTRGTRRAQVTMLLDAATALPSAGKTLASISGGWQRVSWHWQLDGSRATFASSDVAIAEMHRVMTPVAPTPLALQQREAALAARLAVVGMLLLGAITLAAGRAPVVRIASVAIPVWVLARSGVIPDASGGPATMAILAGAALLLLAVVLWHRPARRVPVGVIAALILMGMAQPLVNRAALAVVPSVESWSIAAWFAWQAVLALATSGYLAVASAPLRTTDDIRASPRMGWFATIAAVAVGLLGIKAWSPAEATGWPLWYAVLWAGPVLAMVAVTTPTARRIAVFTMAATLAGLGSWHATLGQRMDLARTDLRRLGASSDAEASIALDHFGDAVLREHATRLPALYALWRASPLSGAVPLTEAAGDSGQGMMRRAGPGPAVPTQLAIWVDTTVVAWLAMNQMQVTWPDLQGLLRDDPLTRRQVGLARDPGLHQVLVLPLGGDTTLTVLLGPRSRLIAATRFGRLSLPAPPAEPPYVLRIESPGQALPDLTFRRTGRHVRADHQVDAGGRPLVVRATISMLPPRPFAVRAALTVLLDVLLGLIAWRSIERMLDTGRKGDARVFRRSHRRTVTAALISFFVVPAGFFTLWSVLRLRQDVARDRGDEVSRALGEILDDPVFTSDEGIRPGTLALAQVADRVDAELGVYRDGRLIAASTPLLAEMGVIAPVIDPAIARSNPEDAGRLATAVPGINVRVGGLATGREHTAVVAALPGADAELERDQLDLALLLLLASLGGTIAAMAVAGAVANALTQPIEALRQRALAIGRREAAPPLRDPPAEFEPVFSAIGQMERDLGQSEARLEEETSRTARIVAWGDMARQVAHEIKNPLTPMRLGLQHLRRLGQDARPDLADQTSATAERLLDEIDRLDRIARSFARYGAPPERDVGPLQPVLLDDVAREIAQLYALAASQMTLEVTGTAGFVMARREEVVQVLLNLLDNAREAGADSVGLVLRPGQLVVADNGRGIPVEQLARIFEPTFSTTTSGTGLGLAIVRRLVEGWGGTITAASRPGDGAEFTIGFVPGDSTPAQSSA